MSETSEALQDDAPYWDPYRPDLALTPYPAFRRLREEAPLYYNETYDFYALSRFADLEAHFANTDVFSSARSDILEFIREDIDIPDGFFIWADPPSHTVYRALLARIFTPRRMNELEDQIRAYCIGCLDPIADTDRFNFIDDIGAKLPGGVIGMLLGIPDSERDAIYQRVTSALRTEEGKPMEADESRYNGEGFEDYVEWRAQNPSDDLMTMLLNAEFTDHKGVTRKLTREEVLIFVNLLAGAGNETTARLIGWMGRVLGDHPDQRRAIAADPSLVNQSIEELLRFEPPGPSVARYVKQDIEIHGQKVPAGSAMLFLVASANRDDRRFEDGDSFNIHRKPMPHITFGRGIHACVGSALARVEGRVAMQEILKRFPNWTVDEENAKLSSSSSTRGWETLPTFIER